MAFGIFALIPLDSFPSLSPSVVLRNLRGPPVPVAELLVAQLAASEVVVVEHPEDVVDLLDVAAVSVAVEEVDSAVAAAVVVVSQEVDAAVVVLVDVAEEDTKCLDPGRSPLHSEYAGNAHPFALPFRLDPTTTYRYHDHLRRFGVDGANVSCLDMAPCYGHLVKDARVIFSSQITLKSNLPDAFGRLKHFLEQSSTPATVRETLARRRKPGLSIKRQRSQECTRSASMSCCFGNRYTTVCSSDW